MIGYECQIAILRGITPRKRIRITRQVPNLIPAERRAAYRFHDASISGGSECPQISLYSLLRFTTGEDSLAIEHCTDPGFYQFSPFLDVQNVKMTPKEAFEYIFKFFFDRSGTFIRYMWVWRPLGELLPLLGHPLTINRLSVNTDDVDFEEMKKVMRFKTLDRMFAPINCETVVQATQDLTQWKLPIGSAILLSPNEENPFFLDELISCMPNSKIEKLTREKWERIETKHFIRWNRDEHSDHFIDLYHSSTKSILTVKLLKKGTVSWD